MRLGIAMIELIFAIVIIAISVMTIPVMMNIAGESAKRIMVDDDVISRLSGVMMDKFQARWGGEYNYGNANEANISVIATTADLGCTRPVGGNIYRVNPYSTTMCNAAKSPGEIPTVAGNGVGEANGHVEQGIEMLNSGAETLNIGAGTVTATYGVSYVDSTVAAGANANSLTATWTLGSSGNLTPGNEFGAVAANRTHLKRVAVTFSDAGNNVDMTLSFFKSNIGSNL
jgi:hypothetical protein